MQVEEYEKWIHGWEDFLKKRFKFFQNSTEWNSCKNMQREFPDPWHNDKYACFKVSLTVSSFILRTLFQELF